ncbi:MAG TPA: VWA domain-containing protein [Bryobacteraceae bacterium]|nr:VWA domain-containing protein [Bryobacteraceae bacterium]
MKYRYVRFLASIAIAAMAAATPLAAQGNPGPGPDQDQASQQNQTTTLSVNVDLVNVLFAVRAKKGGALIPNLTKDNFHIYEDGKEQTIKQFSRETDLPLTLGLLIDISASQGNLISIEQNAASQFFSSVIRTKDEAFLISFGHTTDLLQDYTNSPRLLRSALNGLQGDGSGAVYGGGPIGNPGAIPQTGPPKGTLLYDAIYLASNEKLKNEVGRKAVVLITDGDDQGSYYKIHDAIEAAQRANAIVYSIYYVDRMFYMRAGMIGGGGEGELRKMSDETGGHVFVVDRKHTLSDVFKELQDEMRNQYSIGYTPVNDKRDGTFRRIEIKTNQADYKVQARSGYYATPNGGQ